MSSLHDDRKSQTQALFSSLAPEYDTAGPGIFAYFGRRLVDRVEVDPKQRVLDVATGRGAILIPAAERAGQAVESVGVDLAKGMVDATQSEIERRGLNARVCVMDAEHLDFPDASFDRVFSGFGIMFFPELNWALQEFRRVLKPGGRLGVSTWHTSQTEDVTAVLKQLGLGSGGCSIVSNPTGCTSRPQPSSL
jgi:ubiquinone/menaquinone biosynthesis C-methylase UbiE